MEWISGPDDAADKSSAAFFLCASFVTCFLAWLASRDESIFGVTVMGGLSFLFLWAAALAMSGHLRAG